MVVETFKSFPCYIAHVSRKTLQFNVMNSIIQTKLHEQLHCLRIHSMQIIKFTKEIIFSNIGSSIQDKNVCAKNKWIVKKPWILFLFK